MTSLEQTLEALNHHDVRAFLTKLVGAGDQVDDVLQVVAEKLLKNPPPPARNLRAFLFSTVRNAAIDTIRSESRRDERQRGYGLAAATATDPLEDIIESEQVLDRLNAAVKELPLLTQSVFLDHYVLGYSQREIAASYKLHVSTIEKRLALARRHCCARLKG